MGAGPHRRFATSRVGWRMFGLFLVAAALPIALIALLTDRAMDAAWRESQATVAANTAKAAALQALDRLQVAAQALEVAAGSTRSLAAMPGRAAEPLAAVVEIGPDGTRRVAQGGERAAPLLALPLPAEPGRAPKRLLAAGAAGVALHYADATTGRHWLGLVDPAFLWEDASDLPAGLWLCALGADRAPLYCSDARQADTARGFAGAARASGGDDAPAAPHAVKGLFLAAQFDAPAWTFVAGSSAGGHSALAALASSVVPTAALASLMLVTLLSLTQIRRTLTPLSRLADGARQIAQRRFGARVAVNSRDEFGELADAFNDMAAKIEGQFAELGTLAEVDRLIVEQRGIDAALDTIARRIAALLPGRCVAVARLTSPDADEAVMQRAGAVDGARTLALDEPLRDALRHAEHEGEATGGPVLAGALGWPGLGAARLLPMRWRERRLGFIAIGQRDEAAIEPDVHRQLVELRDRAAVAAHAAEREERLVHEARHDGLTGLLNRSGLYESLEQLLARPAPATVAALVLDLDHFKPINDALGHAAGDQALRLVAARLQRCAGERASVARRAGDEFVVLLPDPPSPAAAAQLAQALCASLASAVTIDGQPFVLGASVGIAVAAAGQVRPPELLRQADHAMYEAKKRGGGRHAFFDPRLDELAQRRAWIERDLPLAALRGELMLVYQPRVEASSGAVRSVEALLRWQHPQQGLVSPVDFIPVAEQGELIEHIGAWVIDAACAQIARWRREGLAGLRVAVNLSARQLDSARLESDLAGAMARHGVAPQELELEITESVFVDHAASTVARLQALRATGLMIALDDFGTGYSSMAYLRQLPLDVMKIDRAFVQDLGRDRSALAVAQAIVTLAAALDLRTVAEGVETRAQWDVLRDLGCHELQGFLFSRPLAPDALPAWLAERVPAAEPA